MLHGTETGINTSRAHKYTDFTLHGLYIIVQTLLILIFYLFAVCVASPEAQRRNSLEKQLERLDNDMSLLSKISILADTLAISHMVNTGLIKDHYFHLILKSDSVISIFVKIIRLLKIPVKAEEPLKYVVRVSNCFCFAFQTLDGAIRELMNEVNRQISEKQIPLQPPTSTKLELHVTQAE